MDAAYEKGGQDYPLSYVRWTENRNMEEFLRLIRPDGVQLQPLITHEYSLDDAAKAYDTILDRESGSLAVVLRYPAPRTLPTSATRRSRSPDPEPRKRRSVSA